MSETAAHASGAFVEVVSAGTGLLVQDLGRAGWAHLGVPPSGALDPDALMLGNRLVGNDGSAAGLEVLLGGVAIVANRSIRVALTGADGPLEVDGRAQPWGEAVSVTAGATLTIASLRGGIRSWLAIDGGIDVPRELGSAATDTLTGLGPDPVRTGTLLPLGRPVPAAAHGAAVPRRTEGGPARLRVRLGPRDDWLTAESIRALTAQTYVVTPDSDRVGVRLRPDDGARLERSGHGELPSEGIVTGAVQVPAAGEPLILLADHPVTGGYPVAAVVERADLWRCAQLRPGDRVRFQRAASDSSSAT